MEKQIFGLCQQLVAGERRREFHGFRVDVSEIIVPGYPTAYRVHCGDGWCVDVYEDRVENWKAGFAPVTSATVFDVLSAEVDDDQEADGIISQEKSEL